MIWRAGIGCRLLGFLLLFIEPLQADDPIRVACLGDSITHGARVKPATESYPARLQQFLGSRYLIRNFGVSGATLWHGGRPTAFGQLSPAAAFSPHLVIVMFGVNDTRSEGVDYWEHFDEFESDARKLLEALRAFPERPRVLLCTPTAHFADLPGMTAERRTSVALRMPRLLEVRAKIMRLAQEYIDHGVKPVDLHAVTAAHREGFDSDGVHLNAAGYTLLAETLLPHVKAELERIHAGPTAP